MNDNTMPRKKQDKQLSTKTLHRKPKIEQLEVNSYAPEG